jgi:hypothetical protein
MECPSVFRLKYVPEFDFEKAEQTKIQSIYQEKRLKNVKKNNILCGIFSEKRGCPTENCVNGQPNAV